ncbi:asparagine synthase [Ramicandelaber brevisporus]|nr:asparagine synthase [Ramicandelaber brevisporus]
MCGIFAVFNYAGDINEYRSRALLLSRRLRHRGPDWSGCKIKGSSLLAHERLAIVGVDSGAQPLTNADETLILTVNGEIYNHKQLRSELKTPVPFATHSDCEVILHMYNEIGPEVASKLDGMFAWVLLDTKQHRLIAARDPIGITTLYKGTSSKMPGTVWFASELKALHDECDTIEAFPPGHVYDSKTGETTRYFNPQWLKDYDAGIIPAPSNTIVDPASGDAKLAPETYKALREALTKAVRKRLMAEVPYGVLLSGGLDSSLIAAITVREARKIAMSSASDSEDNADMDSRAVRSWPRIHSFSIGLPGAPDLVAAKKAAAFLRTIHHEYTFTIEEGHDALADVIYHLETYDVTTIRASTPMYLLSRKIKSMGVKMVLSGEGSDEVLAGYLYFSKAPNSKELHNETVKRIVNLHTADCLRANKSTMAWGLEARVPFLDKEFLQVAMSTVDPATKMSSPQRMEKTIIRKAFDTNCDDVGFTDYERGLAPQQLVEQQQKMRLSGPAGKKATERIGEYGPYLPDSILWRQKEQFSDGVGYSWIDSLRDLAETKISDEVFAKRSELWPDDTPDTKEACWYRQMFDQWFPEKACRASVVRWVPRTDWGCSADPSGRAQALHVAAYEKKESA